MGQKTDIKEFGLFLHLKNTGNLIHYPLEDREYIISRLNELISTLTQMIESEKKVLEVSHLIRERKMYQDDLFIAKQTFKVK